MSELRKVSYSLTGEGAPVVHLECLTIEDARQAYMLASAATIEQAQEKMLNELVEWLEKSNNKQRTAELWSMAFIKCGLCRHSWTQWFNKNPVGDDWRGWVESAKQQILIGQWI